MKVIQVVMIIDLLWTFCLIYTDIYLVLEINSD